MNNKHIEAVARALAIHDGWKGWDTAKNFCDTLTGSDPENERAAYLSNATAAISALEKLGAYVGEGWEAVPSEPTEAMIEAGARVLFELPGFRDPPSAARKIVKDVLLAAKPPMKLHFTNDWLKAQIEKDGDDFPETVP